MTGPLVSVHGGVQVELALDELGALTIPAGFLTGIAVSTALLSVGLSGKLTVAAMALLAAGLDRVNCTLAATETLVTNTGSGSSWAPARAAAARPRGRPETRTACRGPGCRRC